MQQEALPWDAPPTVDDDKYLDADVGWYVVPNHVCDECEHRVERRCRPQQWSLEFLERPEERL